LPRRQEKTPARIAVSVPKKRIATATGRNRIKRLIRECWRLNKHLLYADVPETTQLHLFFIYNGPKNPDYVQVEQSVQDIIAVLRRQQKEKPHA
jgi:ribonuclease P protein component